MMEIGMVGLGRMGMNMVRRLLTGGHRVVVWNRTYEKVSRMEAEGAVGAKTLPELVENLKQPRVIWIMLPAGKVVDDTIDVLSPLLSKDDLLIDGGNGNYRDDLRRAGALSSLGIHYADVGVSGGIWGLKVGYCAMVGGAKEDFKRLEPALKTLAPPDGYLLCGSVGAGHFVKMAHNAIEYAMMQAYGEGFELLKESPYGDKLDFGRIAHLWNQGSVIRSWLLELLESAFEKDPDLSSIAGYVDDSGEGRWAVQEAVEAGVPVSAIALSLFRRFRSRQKDPFSDRVLAVLRKEFGGHRVIDKIGDENKEGTPGR